MGLVQPLSDPLQQFDFLLLFRHDAPRSLVYHNHFDMPNSSASDNFAEFLHAFPGYYCFVGSQPSRPGTSGIHHAPDFDLDESVLPRISFMFLETAKRLENM